MIDVTADGHFEGSCQGLEDAFNLMVLVVALSTDVEVHLGGIAETLEEVQEHLGRHLTDALTMELGIPDEPGASTKVEADAAEAVVHG